MEDVQDESGAPGSARRPARRWLVLLALLGLAFFLGHGALIDLFAGHSRRGALRGERLGLQAATLLEECLESLPEGRLLDLHAHLVGRGAGSDCWVNPRMLTPLHPRDWIRFRCYQSAAGLGPNDHDAAFVRDLTGLAATLPRRVRQYLLAFDHRYTREGRLDLEHSEFHVPNAYVFQVAAESPELFRPAVSVHPYRSDAVPQLERWAEQGARLVKWLPSAQGMDPADPLCRPFFEAMLRRDMVLLVHCGEEQAVEAEADQELGNPLRLRPALDMGLRVVVAHCASLGESRDLDDPAGGRVGSFELFLRLMGEARYEGLLFGEISTVTQINRYPTALRTLLERRDLHVRLLNGSDWPLPAINVLYQTRALVRDGFLTQDQRQLLGQIYQHNPLAFDLALKRLVKSPGDGSTFSDVVFLDRPALGL